jgi:hypothetical protein
MLSTGALFAADPVPVMDPTTMMPDEWIQYRFERLAVIQGNPSLAAQQKDLDEEFKAYAAKVDAATVKANPKTADILSRLKKLLHSKWSGTEGPGAISIADWQTLRAARSAALDANPSLVAESQALLAKKKSLDKEVDAALVKEDPSLAPFIAKLHKIDSKR